MLLCNKICRSQKVFGFWHPWHSFVVKEVIIEPSVLPGHCIEEAGRTTEHYSIKWPGSEHVNQTASCLLSRNTRNKRICGLTGSFSYLLSESVAISFLPPKRIWHWKDMRGMIMASQETLLFFKPHSRAQRAHFLHFFQSALIAPAATERTLGFVNALNRSRYLYNSSNSRLWSRQQQKVLIMTR